MVIYLESDKLDELDHTVNEYRQFALGKLNSNGRFTFNIVGHLQNVPAFMLGMLIAMVLHIAAVKTMFVGQFQ